MGACFSSEAQGTKEEVLRNAQIELELKKDKPRLKNELKLLLLGAGEAGKSTILKQMKLIHEGSYPKAEREAYKWIIFNNVVTSMLCIVDAMDYLSIPFTNPQADHYIKILSEAIIPDKNTIMTGDVANAIKELYADPGIKTCMSRSNEYQLNDSTQYYFDSIDRMAAPNYVPTDQDVLRSRVKTTGITELSFTVNNQSFKMVDVGGQRSERKKWIHCFEGVTAIIFIVAISEYDQHLLEDESVNRMHEALTLFDSICNSRFFIKTSIILFLNKIDLFEMKIAHSPLTQCFPDYTGPSEFKPASDFIREKFVALKGRNDQKQIYTHLTCATDTTQIQRVMADVNDIILRNVLRETGLL